jgi:4-hydroxy-tetrahydrodipicolinate synthase
MPNRLEFREVSTNLLPSLREMSVPPNLIFRGVFAIPSTPFHLNGAIDEPSLLRRLDLCLAAGAHGIVTPVIASRVCTLSAAERHRVAELAVGRFAGRVPVVMGVPAV